MLLVERAGEPVVLRLVPSAPRSAANLSELLVLAGLRHPNLARLVDHGTLADGTHWTARAWIEGRDLASWWRARRGTAGADAEFGALLVRLATALDHLHGRGFVHGDLKPENVIVRDDGEPVLTDFGFASERGAARGAAGTPFYAAPEVLRGAPASPAIDLFSLGATLVRALVPRELRASELYARFPAVPFLEALGVAVEDLPDWARDVAIALVERDPALRGRSAASVARTLAGRLGLRADLDARVELEFPVLEGRADWLAGVVADLASAHGSHWIRVRDGENASEVAACVRLAAAVAGQDTTAIERARIGGLEPGSAALVARADEIAAQCGQNAAFLAPDADAASGARCLQLARSMAARGGRLVVVSTEPAPDATFRATTLPAPELAHVVAFLRREIDLEPGPRAEDLARALYSADATAHDVRARLARAVEDGWILAGDSRPRLRAGRSPTEAELAPRAIDARSLDARTRRLVTAIAVLGGRAPLTDAARLAQADPNLLLEERPRWLRLAEGGELALDVDPKSLELDPLEVRELHARRAAEITSGPRGETRMERALCLHELAASGSRENTEAMLAHIRSARESGAPAEALDLARRAEDALRSAHHAVDPRFAVERALSWIRLGESTRAREEFDPEAPRGVPALEAARRAVSSALAFAAGDVPRALEQARAAADLDPAWRDARVDLEARALFDAADDAGLERLAGDLDERTGARTRANARNLVAASLQRRGEIARAREMFRDLLLEAEDARDSARAAALSQNLGTLERRAGNLELAKDLFARAADLHATAGSAAGLAHARTQLGGVLRELGELCAAADAARSALDLTERLGDPLQAAVARGALGLVLADRGHVHAAREELRRASAALESAGRRAHAALLDARSEELAARVGRPAAAGARARAGSVALDADPRALLALARAAWMRGDTASARDRARRAGDLARSLQQEAVRAEAELVLALLRGERGTGGGDDDARLDALLARGDVGTRDTAKSAGRSTVDPSARDLADAEFAASLALRGRDDRAARAWVAIAAQAEDPALRARGRVEAAACFAACARGLPDAETRALARHLLARPDPRPADMSVLSARGAEEEEDEMDVVRLLEINQRLVDEEEPEKLLGAIVEHALAVTGAQRGFVVLEQEGQLVFDTALDSRRGDIDTPELEVSRSVVAQALERGTPLLVSNAVEDPDLAGAPSVANLDLRSILCVPFTIDAQTRGVVYVDNRVREGAFGPRAERLLTLLAGQAALAIRQVQRVGEIRRLNRRLEEQVAHTESDLKSAQEALRDAGMPGVATGLVGRSPAIRRVHDRIARAAQATTLPVLVSGDSGTGKELAARALHATGPRAAGPFVVENCAALPASLVEAELFGAVRGAFTGAENERPGLFERADGGTLFLDEIGELPIELQAKLLRVLETGEVRRLGEARVRSVDFRLIAATNRDLEAEVRGGRFRADLFYRLDGLRIEMPSLAERVEDVPLLVDHFLRLEAARGRPARHASAEVVAALSRRSWPGNVRELRNEIARLLVMCAGDLEDPTLIRPASDTRAEPSERPTHVPLVTLAELERMAIERALEAAGGDKGRAAEMLGISRAKVYQRIQAWREEKAAPEGSSA
ncbi:MAG: sigma 54-interacting transcriptional regulator [Planctomycetota bacterium]|nr:sigma 54-interacting transcriptional regulator [Planctomycetota bacterium]